VPVSQDIIKIAPNTTAVVKAADSRLRVRVLFFVMFFLLWIQWFYYLCGNFTTEEIGTSS
jgi:hypothetical protein